MGAGMAIPEPQTQKDIILQELSELVSCRGEYRRDAEQLIQRVEALMSTTIANSYGSNSRGRLQQLRPEFQFSLKDSIIGGSFGKRTEVLAPDVDVVFRLNGVTAPLDEKFPPVLEYLEEFLKTATQLPIITGSIKRTNYTVGFTTYNGMEFELLPATSITDPEEIYQIMRDDNNKARYYKSSLVEREKSFMKEQSAFVHGVARLGKWFKLIYFGQHFSAGDTFIELISVAASMITKDENGSESFFRAFWKTLEMIENHKSLQLAFVRDEAGTWKIDPSRRWGNYVTEPSDPAENLLDNDGLRNALPLLRKTAHETIKCLGRWKNSEINLIDLFEPHPLNIEKSLVDNGGILPEIIYVGYNPLITKFLEVNVWNRRVLELRQLRKVFEVLKIRVHSLFVCDFQESRRVGPREDISEFVRENILKWLPNANVTTNQSIQANTFDVTMSFSLGNGFSLRVSVKWRNNLL